MTTQSRGASLARAVVLFVRVLQIVAALFAGLFVVGSLNAPVITFLVAGVFALVLFGVVVMLEVIVVRPLQRWSA